MEKRQFLQQVVLGKLDSHMWKTEIGTFSHTIYKTKLKMDQRPKCNHGNNETSRREYRQNTLWHKLKHFFSPKAEETKAKTNLI